MQLGALYGAAIGLVNSGAMRELDGTVRLRAVPAEEGINISGREALIRAGKIKTFNGKQEFIRLGLFDGVSAALMQHTSQSDKVSAGGAGGLCVVPKLVRYRGRSAHPVNAHIGVNALTAARIGLDAVDHMVRLSPEWNACLGVPWPACRDGSRGGKRQNGIEYKHQFWIQRHAEGDQ